MLEVCVRTKWLGLLGLGCAAAPVDRGADARQLPVLLARVEADPAAAVQVCAPLSTPAVRADCVLHGVERLAKQDPDGAAALCATLSGLGADECHFQVAERSGDVDRCSAAGRFEADCRMHAWSVRVPGLAGPDASDEAWGRRIAEAAAAMGFEAGDERPWIAAGRHVLGRSLPLDRSACDAWPEVATDACRRAGLGLFHDRLNHVRDAGSWDCSGAPPTLLGFDPADAELAAAFAARKGEICP